MEQQHPQQVLSPSSSGRRSTSFSNSPEFEFWMLRNPSFPQPNILPADQLFAGGVLLPLHLLPPANSDDPNPQPSENPNPDKDPLPKYVPEPDPGSDLSSSTSLTTTLTASKRWTDIFKKSDRKSSNNHEGKENDKKKERRGGTGGGKGASSAELNIINIWPFSRSRSSGNGGSRPRVVTRKVSSAPCSRSNSAGESKSRKWPASPARGARVHLRRSSPVWQVRRGGGSVAKNGGLGVGKEGSESRAACSGARAKVLKLNVPMCIGYRHRLSCKTDLNSSVVVSDRDTDVAGHNGDVGSCDGGRGGNILNLRSFFSGKVF